MNKENNIKLKKFKTTYGEHPLMLTDNTIGFAMDVKELIKHHEQMNIPLDIITSITEINDDKPTSAPPLPESVEEAAVKGFNARFGTEKDGAYYFGFKDGSDWHQYHHSAEVERLREVLKGIGNSAVYMINHEHQTVINSGLINHILETVNLALSQNALKEK